MFYSAHVLFRSHSISPYIISSLSKQASNQLEEPHLVDYVLLAVFHMLLIVVVIVVVVIVVVVALVLSTA